MMSQAFGVERRLDQTARNASFIITEEDGHFSRENGVVAHVADLKLQAGTIVGSARGAVSTAAFAINGSNKGSIGTVVAGAGAKVGKYKVTIIEPASNAGEFVVEDPDGDEVGTGVVAVEFVGGGLTFTLADGSTDWIAGEGYDIIVAAGTGKLKAWDSTATDGSEVVKGILIYGVNASEGADVSTAYLTNDAEVNVNQLIYPTGQLAAATAGLLALRIKVR